MKRCDLIFRKVQVLSCKNVTISESSCHAILFLSEVKLVHILSLFVKIFLDSNELFMENILEEVKIDVHKVIVDSIVTSKVACVSLFYFLSFKVIFRLIDELQPEILTLV
jgi:hypothetical protein